MDEKRLLSQFDKLNRKMRRYFDGFFAGMPLTSVQALVLQYIIVESKTRPVFTRDLEEFLGIQGSSVTSLVNNLERGGYLRRESLEEDGRFKKLVLTPQSQEIAEEIMGRVGRYMESLFVGIPEEELRVFEAVLQKMTRNIG